MNKYSVSVIEKTENTECGRRIGFEFENHDDLFLIAKKIQSSGFFNKEQEAVQFSIGLKLFSSIMMKYRGEELFKDFEPAFIEFMKKLKTKK